MTAIADRYPNGTRRAAARSAKPIGRRFRAAEIARKLLQFLHPNPASQLSSSYHRTRKQLIRDTVDRMRADMGMVPVKWPRMRF